MKHFCQEKNKEYGASLIEMIRNCPTAYQTVDIMRRTLNENGYTELYEQQEWTLRAGGKYFVTRNGSSLIAFCVPSNPASVNGYQIVATHADSPAFKLKPIFEHTAPGGVLEWNVERYGGMICSSWMDRPLSVAGRVLVSSENGLRSVSVDLDRDVALIPNVAIHMDRTVNEGKKFNLQTDMQPLVAMDGEQGFVLGEIAQRIGVDEKSIVSHDLFLYVRDEGRIWGMNDEFISAPRIDDLMCTFAALHAFLQGAHEKTVPVLAVFDNEEIGSSSRQGAGSSFMRDTLGRIDAVLCVEGEKHGLQRRMMNSCLLSADNAHAVHPNHPEYADAQNRPCLNGGVVIKHNACQRYATDAISDAVFQTICRRAGVQTQTFANRSDIAGGSTLGNIAVSDVPFLALDIGVAQLAMHSAYETAGLEDVTAMMRAMSAFYHTSLRADGAGAYEIDISER